VLGEVTATPGTFKAYASGASDGSQVPKCILKYAVVVDGSQNYWYGDTSGSSEWGNAQKYGIAYRSGVFNCADLVGFDAGALSAMGKLKTGSVTTGVVVITGE